jgi:hypothetical protein
MTTNTLEANIAAVRTAAEDPRGAYLIRSRLRRSVLACTRAVAAAEGLERPALPGHWISPASDDGRRIVSLCRRIHDRSQALCQPSESFDVRWEAGWGLLQADLTELEAAVSSLKRVRSRTPRRSRRLTF